MDEIALAWSIKLLSAKKIEALYLFKPIKPDLSKEIHIDWDKINDRILALYRAARSEITLLPTDIVDPEVRLKVSSKFLLPFHLLLSLKVPSSLN